MDIRVDGSMISQPGRWLNTLPIFDQLFVHRAQLNLPLTCIITEGWMTLTRWLCSCVCIRHGSIKGTWANLGQSIHFSMLPWGERERRRGRTIRCRIARVGWWQRLLAWGSSIARLPPMTEAETFGWHDESPNDHGRIVLKGDMSMAAMLTAARCFKGLRLWPGAQVCC